MHKLTATTLSALALSAAAAAPASADSISYIKDGNVWLTTPDGGRQFQVTTAGGYSYASQADDGTFIALKGELLHRLDRFGNVTAEFKTPVSDGPPPATPPAHDDTTTNYFHGPFEPEISPDGSKVSYTYMWQHYSYNYTGGWMEQRLESGTAITYPDRLTAWDEFGGNLTGWQNGSWIDNDSLLRSDAGVPLSEHAVINDGIAPGAKSELVRWFREGIYGSWDFQDPELSRDGSKLAFVVNEPDPTNWVVRIYRTTGAPPAEPEGCFRIVPDGPHTEDADAPASPSWSPDGMALAYADNAGVHAVTGIDLSGGCALPAGAAEKVIVPGAKQPDWGPADVPTARPAAPAAPAGPAAPGTTAAPQPGAPFTVDVASASRKRIRLTATVPAAGRIAATAKRGKRVVARRSVTAPAAGRQAVVLRIARRKLRGARKLTVKVTFAGQAKTVRVKL